MQGLLVELIMPSMAVFFSACFLVLWKVSGLGRHVLAFAATYFFAAIGFLIAVILPPDSTITFQASQLAYSISALCMVWGACERANQRAFLGVLVSIYLVAATMLIFEVVLTQDVGPRLIISNMGYGSMLLVGVVSLLMAQRRQLADNLIITIIALNALDFFVRPSMTLLIEGQIDAAAYHDSLYFSLINLVLNIKGVATATVLFSACIADYLVRLKRTAQHDDLTGLKNRAAFEVEAHKQLKRGEEERAPVSMIVADIDHFKQVNDIWGHQAGDTAIANFASLFDRMVRGCDLSARVGGEEFCIVAWDCPLEDATRLAERIRIAFAQMQHMQIGAEIHLTASFGVAQMRAGERYESLFARADEALYCAKEEGRNQVSQSEGSRVRCGDVSTERKRTRRVA